MLEIDDLSYRIAGRPLFDGASAFIADGWKVGLVGRNGTGKSTLLKIIREEAEKSAGSVRLKRGARLGYVAQEIPLSDEPLLQVVLATHHELAALTEEAETATDPHRIADIHMRLAELDAYSAEARASAILVGLGFSQPDLARASREFSGGWRMRAALAGVLFAEPELLLLDEPTNFLDLEGAAWLEDYLKRYPHTVVLVSHDRDMLNRSVTHILALADLKLELCPGGYDAYLKRRAERSQLQQALKAKQDKERAHLQTFIDRFRAKASKATQAQSRIKRLEKMQDIAVPLDERTIPFQFETVDELASPLVVLDAADLGYVEHKPILHKVSFRLDQDDRIVILGPNGEGKTTLVKSIAGILPLLTGKRVASKQLRIGYFSQDQLELLRANESVLEHVNALEPEWPPAKQRALAARIGFGHEKIETKVERLSGGEKVRLALGIVAHAKPHVLILDEPTSHLDIDSREALIHAINAYAGAILLITHDVYLAEACADRLWLIKGGQAQPYDGDLSEYRALILSADRRQSAQGANAPSKSERKRASAGPSRSTLDRRLSEAEKALAHAQSQLAATDQKLADPELFNRDPERGAALSRERARLAKALETAEETWLQAEEALALLDQE